MNDVFSKQFIVESFRYTFSRDALGVGGCLRVRQACRLGGSFEWAVERVCLGPPEAAVLARPRETLIVVLLGPDTSSTESSRSDLTTSSRAQWLSMPKHWRFTGLVSMISTQDERRGLDEPIAMCCGEGSMFVAEI
jgi:hypothetical protein